MDDGELLREYQEHRSEQAFTQLVERHLPLVYSVALRVVREPETAEDVAQAVFIQLAHKAWSARDGQALSGWLYRATRRDALDALRNEKRRRQRETEAMNLAEKSTRPEIASAQIAPMLEEAMGKLRRIEQDAVVLRFYEGKSLRETGEILALSEEAARKRVDRALDKMRAYFARSGITASAALLASELSAHARMAPVPAGLAAKVAGASVAGASVAGTGGLFQALIKTFFMNAITKMTLVAIAAGGAAFMIGNMKGAAKAGADALYDEYGSDGYTSKGSKPKPPTMMSREEALQQWTHYIQQPPMPSDAPIETVEALQKAKSDREIYLDGRTDRTDIPYLLENIAKLTPSTERDRREEAFLGQYGIVDPETAISLANFYLTDPKNRDTEVQQIITQLVIRDPQRAIQELSKLEPGPQTQTDYGSAFAFWAQSNNGESGPVAAATAFALPTGPERTAALQGVANAWTAYAPQAAFEWASGLVPTDAEAFGPALIKIGKQKPTLAARYVNIISDASVRNQAIETIAHSWALGQGRDSADPAAALNWLDQVATGDTYDANVDFIRNSMAATNPNPGP